MTLWMTESLKLIISTCLSHISSLICRKLKKRGPTLMISIRMSHIWPSRRTRVQRPRMEATEDTSRVKNVFKDGATIARMVLCRTMPARTSQPKRLTTARVIWTAASNAGQVKMLASSTWRKADLLGILSLYSIIPWMVYRLDQLCCHLHYIYVIIKNRSVNHWAVPEARAPWITLLKRHCQQMRRTNSSNKLSSKRNRDKLRKSRKAR